MRQCRQLAVTESQDYDWRLLWTTMFGILLVHLPGMRVQRSPERRPVWRAVQLVTCTTDNVHKPLA